TRWEERDDRFCPEGDSTGSPRLVSRGRAGPGKRSRRSRRDRPGSLTHYDHTGDDPPRWVLEHSLRFGGFRPPTRRRLDGVGGRRRRNRSTHYSWAMSGWQPARTTDAPGVEQA